MANITAVEREIRREMKKLEASPSVWEERLTTAANQREQFEDVWAACERAYFQGDHDSEEGPGVDLDVGDGSVRVNRIKGLVDTSHAATTLNNPRGKVYPRTGGDATAAVWAEKWLNQSWERYGARGAFREMAKDVATIGHGWLKVGWHHVEQDVEVFEFPTVADDADAVTLLSQLSEFSSENPDMVSDLPDVDDVNRQLETPVEPVSRTETEVVMSRPFVERVSPYDMWVDPTAAKMEDIRYIVQRVFRTVNSIRRDESYDKKVRSQVSGGAVANLNRGGSSHSNYTGRNQHYQQGTNNEDDRLVAVYEYWSVEDDHRWGVWCEGSNGWLIAPEPWPMAEHPFLYTKVDGLPSSFYPTGQVYPVLSLQSEINFIRSKQLEFIDNYSPKVLMKEDILVDSTVEDLGSDDPLTVVRLKLKQNQNLHEVVMPLPQPSMPHEWSTMSEVVGRDIDQVGGVPDYAMPSNRRRSATEAAIQQDQSSVRAQEKNNVFEMAAAEVMRRWVAMAQEYLQGVHPLRLTDDQAENINPRFVQMVRQDLVSAAEFEFKIEVSSMAPRDDVVNRLESIQLLNALFPLMQSGVVNPKPAVERVLTSFGVTNVDDFLAESSGVWRFPPPVFQTHPTPVSYTHLTLPTNREV